MIHGKGPGNTQYFLLFILMKRFFFNGFIIVT
jgi:hypothetical protein